MTIALDSVLTVAIGRNGLDGTPLAPSAWRDFQEKVAGFLVLAGGTIVAHTTGHGLTSDGDTAGSEEESCVFVAINVEDLDRARKGVARALRKVEQSSACFAFDGAHDPVFPTANGFRPAAIDDGFGGWLAEGNARRTQLVR